MAKARRKKNESLQEAELDECWSTHERVPGTKKGAPGSCRRKGTKEGIEEGDLQKWLDQDWKRIDSSGNVAGECGTSKDKKNPDRCLPADKARSPSKKQRASTAKKKKRAQKTGKDSGKTSNVANTKAAKVKSENIIHEGHGLSKKDVDYLSDAISSLSDKELKRILRFLVKSNVEVSKTKDISKEKNK